MTIPKKPVTVAPAPSYPAVARSPIDRREFILLLGAGTASAAMLGACGGREVPLPGTQPRPSYPVQEPHDPDAGSDALEDPEDPADSDGDRIPDDEDMCPRDPETYNGLEDGDGCPDRPQGVVIPGHEIRILQKAYFAHGSRKVLAMSRAVLDEISRTLVANPQIDLVLAVGHVAANEGADGYKLSLSRSRAKAVVDYLAGKGVAAGRLRAIGASDACPVDDGKGERAWAKNRRVELKIISIDGAPGEADPLCEEAVRRGLYRAP